MSDDARQYAPSAARNRDPIWAVLARPAGYLEHEALARQLRAEHRPDRIAIARRRGRVLAGIVAHASVSRTMSPGATRGAPLPSWRSHASHGRERSEANANELPGEGLRACRTATRPEADYPLTRQRMRACPVDLSPWER